METKDTKQREVKGPQAGHRRLRLCDTHTLWANLSHVIGSPPGKAYIEHKLAINQECISSDEARSRREPYQFDFGNCILKINLDDLSYRGQELLSRAAYGKRLTYCDSRIIKPLGFYGVRDSYQKYRVTHLSYPSQPAIAVTLGIELVELGKVGVRLQSMDSVHEWGDVCLTESKVKPLARSSGVIFNERLEPVLCNSQIQHNREIAVLIVNRLIRGEATRADAKKLLNANSAQFGDRLEIALSALKSAHGGIHADVLSKVWERHFKARYLSKLSKYRDKTIKLSAVDDVAAWIHKGYRRKIPPKSLNVLLQFISS